MELLLDAKMLEVFDGWRTPRGAVASRAVQETLEERQACWRYMARRVIEAKRAKVPREVVQRMVQEFGEWVDDVFESNAGRLDTNTSA